MPEENYTPDSNNEQYGITASLAGYTIESENVTDTPQVEPIPDQHNAVAQEIEYDKRYDLRITVRGKAKPSSEGILVYDGKRWVIDTVEKAGTYNGLRRFNITAHRFNNFPKQDNGANDTRLKPSQNVES